jgi:hypothetical protein
MRNATKELCSDDSVDPDSQLMGVTHGAWRFHTIHWSMPVD